MYKKDQAIKDIVQIFGIHILEDYAIKTKHMMILLIENYLRKQVYKIKIYNFNLKYILKVKGLSIYCKK
jgi:hypothetical protein